jgi:hypothetical protein
MIHLLILSTDRISIFVRPEALVGDVCDNAASFNKTRQVWKTFAEHNDLTDLPLKQLAVMATEFHRELHKTLSNKGATK